MKNYHIDMLRRIVIPKCCVSGHLKYSTRVLGINKNNFDINNTIAWKIDQK